jgi:hypothetical protein
VEYYLADSPFKGMSEPQALEAMKEMGEEFSKQFPIYEQSESLCLSVT